MAYIGTTPKDVRSFGKAKFDFTATASQTVFTGADDDGKTLGFTAGQISVYVNGILMDDSDFTVSNGNTVTLASPANAGDIISVVALQTDIPNSDYVPATGGTFSGDVAFQGAFTSRGIDDNAIATAMTLDGIGNLLVGKTAATISIDGAELRPTGEVVATTNGLNVAYFNRRSSDGSIAEFRKDGTTVGSIGTYGDAVLFGSASYTAIKCVNSATRRVVPSAANGGIADGNTELGDSGSRFKDLYLSGGVYLGGTGSANLLDDYEEGTWTPVLAYAFGGTWEGTPTTGNVGKYTKIGNTVVATATLAWSGDNGGTKTPAYVIVKGLPFATANVTYQRWAGSLGGVVGITMPAGFESGFALNADPNNSFAFIIARSTSGYTHNPTTTSSGNIYGMTITYQTDA